jgi:hypothetical protein
MSTRACKEFERRDARPLSNPFERLQGEVALASLDSAHVRPVDAEQLGERLLTESFALSVGAQILADRPLKLAFHHRKARGLLLYSLQTYE